MRIILTVVLTLATTACAAAPQPELTAAEKAEITAAVHARVDGYVDATRRLDFEWFREFWANTDDFVIAGDGGLMDYPSWIELLESDLAGIRQIIDFEFYNRHTYVLARDAAVHTAQFRWALLQTSGDTLRMHGSWSYVFRNTDGVWKVVHSAGTHLPD